MQATQTERLAEIKAKLPYHMSTSTHGDYHLASADCLRVCDCFWLVAEVERLRAALIEREETDIVINATTGYTAQELRVEALLRLREEGLLPPE